MLLTDGDRPAVAVSVHPRRDHYQFTRPRIDRAQLLVDVQLLVAGFDRAGIRRHPHLHEVHVLIVRLTVQPPGVVLLRVRDAGARAHPLGESGIDNPAVAIGIFVHQ